MSNYNLNNPDSQNSQILAWLKKGRSITPRQALDLFDCFRLSARIWDLRDAGWNIKTIDAIVGKNKKHVAKYYLDTPERYEE